MRIVRLATRALVRDWRAKELIVLALSLIIAVAAVTTVGFFTARLDVLLNRQATELLAADLVVDSSEPAAPRWIAQAHRLGLETAQVLTFPSVVLAGEQTVLVSVKGVDTNYPLRGILRTAPQPFAEDTPTTKLPKPGEAWVEARLLGELGIAVGDSIELGQTKLLITRVLTLEPDRGGDLIRVAPRLFTGLADVEASGLLLPGSRVSYRLLLAGPAAALETYRKWLEPQLKQGQELRDVRNARPELRRALERTERFFGLASLVAVLLASVAIAMNARHFTDRHVDGSALLRCLGAARRQTLAIYLLELLLLTLPTSLVGTLIGYAAQQGLVVALAGQLPQDLPPPSLRPIAQGLATAFIIVLGFAAPPLLRLGRVTPLRVLRRNLAPPSVSGSLLYGMAAGAMIGLMY